MPLVNENAISHLTELHWCLFMMMIVQLLDVCLLDAGSLQYSYSVLAASAVHFVYSQDAALSVSGMLNLE